jgi:penicillin-binding protein 2
MNRLMKDYPEIYTTKNYAVRQAVINLSKGRVTAARLDAYKADYDPFAWVVTLAPADDPKIAVAVLLFQGRNVSLRSAGSERSDREIPAA